MRSGCEYGPAFRDRSNGPAGVARTRLYHSIPSSTGEGRPASAWPASPLVVLERLQRGVRGIGPRAPRSSLLRGGPLARRLAARGDRFHLILERGQLVDRIIAAFGQARAQGEEIRPLRHVFLEHIGIAQDAGNGLNQP